MPEFQDIADLRIWTTPAASAGRPAVDVILSNPHDMSPNYVLRLSADQAERMESALRAANRVGSVV